MLWVYLGSNTNFELIYRIIHVTINGLYFVILTNFVQKGVSLITDHDTCFYYIFLL